MTLFRKAHGPLSQLETPSSVEKEPKKKESSTFKKDPKKKEKEETVTPEDSGVLDSKSGFIFFEQFCLDIVKILGDFVLFV